MTSWKKTILPSVIVCKLFKTPEKLKCHIKDCFTNNGKQTIKTLKKG